MRSVFSVLYVFLFLAIGCQSGAEQASSTPEAVPSETPSQPTAPSVEASPATTSPVVNQDIPYTIEDSSQIQDLGDGLLLYYVKKGSGPSPNIQNNVLFHYHGTLTSGEVFDSSFNRGQPLDSPLQRLIRGWQIALQEVPLGSKIKLIIPPELGYGAQGSTSVPPNATIIFDIELISMY